MLKTLGPMDRLQLLVALALLITLWLWAGSN